MTGFWAVLVADLLKAAMKVAMKFCYDCQNQDCQDFRIFRMIGCQTPFGAAISKETAHGLIFRDFERQFAV